MKMSSEKVETNMTCGCIPLGNHKFRFPCQLVYQRVAVDDVTGLDSSQNMLDDIILFLCIWCSFFEISI